MVLLWTVLGVWWLPSESVLPLARRGVIGMIPTYNCKHHYWQSWTHYGIKMPESGCKLKGGLFDCGYHNAELCPNFEPKEQEAEEWTLNHALFAGEKQKWCHTNSFRKHWKIGRLIAMGWSERTATLQAISFGDVKNMRSMHGTGGQCNEQWRFD